MPIDWVTIKTEYINDQSTSFRKLAEKHNVNKDTIARRAKAEDWATDRHTHVYATQTMAIQMAEEKTAEALSDEAASKARIRASIMRIAEGWFERQEKYIADGLEIDPADFRRMVQSYKDLCETGNPLGDEDNGTGVVMMPEVTSVE